MAADQEKGVLNAVEGPGLCMTSSVLYLRAQPHYAFGSTTRQTTHRCDPGTM